ncbi:hypothetical protein [Chengkuizengella marina]|uniref:Transposase n=1 Tax=Chengkuizengella marina TaxID=2507566 RepID=A0A6N9PZE2_9BACL|nr:hypothetical protein [Chengkuizengella marina]NBI27793.1 hypothetical protein [Chengkuizengella marina]
MPKRKAFSVEDKLEILKSFEEGKYSLNEFSYICKVYRTTFMDWKHKFDKYGTEGLKGSCKKYSLELKLSIELSPEVKAKRGMKMLEKRMNDYELRNVFLKKLEEIERSEIKQGSI